MAPFRRRCSVESIRAVEPSDTPEPTPPDEAAEASDDVGVAADGASATAAADVDAADQAGAAPVDAPDTAAPEADGAAEAA